MTEKEFRYRMNNIRGAITTISDNINDLYNEFCASESKELAATTANSVRDAIVAHVNEFCNICDLTEVQLTTMRNFSSWVQQRHP